MWNILKNMIYYKYSLLMLLGLLCLGCTKYDESIPKKVLQRNLVFASQADIEEFMEDYQDVPELAIDGNVIIGRAVNNGESSNITNLESLSKLTRVGKNLIISMNSGLTSLKGLENLEQVGGTLRIQYNGLQDELNLSSLRSVDSLVLVENSGIRSIAGLSSFKYAGSIKITHQNQLEDLHGLDNITSLKNLYLEKNNKLDDLDGLERLKVIRENLYLLVNAGLSSLDGLDSLRRVGKNIILYRNTHLAPEDFNPLLEQIYLPRLTYIGGNFALENIRSTQSLLLPVLDSIAGSLVITQASQLSSLSGIPGLVYIGKDLHVKQSLLPNFSGLEKLNMIGGSLLLEENNKLSSLQGLEKLQEVGSEIRLMLNPELSSLEGLSALQTTDSININQNLKLSNFCPLKAAVQSILDSDAENPAQLIDLSGNARGTYTHEQLLSECQ